MGKRLTLMETLCRGQRVLKGKPEATEGRAEGKPDPAAGQAHPFNAKWVPIWLPPTIDH